jgi:hypothetical protein
MANLYLESVLQSFVLAVVTSCEQNGTENILVLWVCVYGHMCEMFDCVYVRAHVKGVEEDYHSVNRKATNTVLSPRCLKTIYILNVHAMVYCNVVLIHLHMQQNVPPTPLMRVDKHLAIKLSPTEHLSFSSSHCSLTQG